MFRNPYADGLILLVIVLLFFGPKRLPTLGRSLGQGMREFKESITGESKHEDADERPELTQATTAPVATGAATPDERRPVETAPTSGESAERSS
jgi:sec-independent protein translocase protein TatA